MSAGRAVDKSVTRVKISYFPAIKLSSSFWRKKLDSLGMQSLNIISGWIC